MTDRTPYWIWLCNGVGFCSPKPKRVLELYTDIRELFDGGERELRYCGIFTETEITRLLKTPLSFADDIISDCKIKGFEVIDISDDKYSKRLAEIENPPAVLYVQGDMPDVDILNCVSIIGTRKATIYGIRTAFELGSSLSKNDFVVVSGGALGIDCAAHRGVLQSNGITICVLGCGIDYDYLRENRVCVSKSHKKVL